MPISPDQFNHSPSVRLNDISINLLLSKNEITLLEAACLITGYHPKDTSTRKDKDVLLVKDRLIEEAVKGKLNFRFDNVSPYFDDFDSSNSPTELDFYLFESKSFLTWIKTQSWCPNHLKNIEKAECEKAGLSKSLEELHTNSDVQTQTAHKAPSVIPQELFDMLASSTDSNPDAVLAIINHIKVSNTDLKVEERASKVVKICVLEADKHYTKHGYSPKKLIQIFCIMYSDELEIKKPNGEKNNSLIERIAKLLNPNSKGGRLPTKEHKKKILWERSSGEVANIIGTL